MILQSRTFVTAQQGLPPFEWEKNKEESKTEPIVRWEVSRTMVVDFSLKKIDYLIIFKNISTKKNVRLYAWFFH